VLACVAGELEFDEFVLILTTKLGVGQQKQATWQELSGGLWALEVGPSGCLGSAAVTQGLVSGPMQLLARPATCKLYTTINLRHACSLTL
jgi:hypothetical protein